MMTSTAFCPLAVVDDELSVFTRASPKRKSSFFKVTDVSSMEKSLDFASVRYSSFVSYPTKVWGRFIFCRDFPTDKSKLPFPQAGSSTLSKGGLTPKEDIIWFARKSDNSWGVNVAPVSLIFFSTILKILHEDTSFIWHSNWIT